jgi:putative nucleotidyltransferase with HDIG domain
VEKYMKPRNSRLKSSFLDFDKELVVVLLLVAITAIIYFFVSNQRAFLNFFYLPVLLGAYFYGKRYATLAALFSIILISVVAYVFPVTFSSGGHYDTDRWLDIGTWGGFLLVTGYLMGLMYEKKEDAREDIRQTYHGVIEMLSLVINSIDQNTYSHSRRVSVLSEKIALEMGCSEQQVENIRVAALLHDVGKIGVNRDVLSKIGQLSAAEREHLKAHTSRAVGLLKPLGGRVVDLLPLIFGHHEKYDGNGYHSLVGEDIPLGARIISVADVYDALTSDRPYRKALPPFQAKSEIMSNAGSHFDPQVVKVFESVFSTLDDAGPGRVVGLHG